jgi:hypothetical protein
VLPPSTQPEEDYEFGDNGDPTGTPPPFSPITAASLLPTCNTDPDTNWYFANGMLMNPLPDEQTYPGPLAAPGTQFLGYQPCWTDLPGGQPCLEPNYLPAPQEFGGNERYYMLWNYRKRVSVIVSPSIRAVSVSGSVIYRRPIVDPPVASVPAGQNLEVDLRSSASIDFSVPQLDSDWVSPAEDDFSALVSGPTGNFTWVKFRATFGAGNSVQPPTIDSIVIPYLKVGVDP